MKSFLYLIFLSYFFSTYKAHASLSEEHLINRVSLRGALALNNTLFEAQWHENFYGNEERGFISLFFRDDRYGLLMYHNINLTDQEKHEEIFTIPFKYRVLLDGTLSVQYPTISSKEDFEKKVFFNDCWTFGQLRIDEKILACEKCYNYSSQNLPARLRALTKKSTVLGKIHHDVFILYIDKILFKDKLPRGEITYSSPHLLNLQRKPLILVNSILDSKTNDFKCTCE
jgi:hypothetical protein